MDTQKRIIIWVSVVLVVGITLFAIWNVATFPAETPKQNNQGLLTEQITDTDWTKGAKDPKITLVEYSDFQCPACGTYHPVIEKVFEEYKDRMTFTYRHFPLPQHKNALAASYAAEAAGNQGKFWEMHTMIFEHQSEWSEEINAEKIFEGYAKDIDLDISLFKADAKSVATKNNVSHNRETGLKAGVNSTPSFYLNGKRMQNPRGYEEFKALIEYALING